jgi:hypothetical protein
MKNVWRSFQFFPYLFVFLSMLFIPFSFHVFSFQPAIAGALFQPLISWIEGPSENTEISSDSGAMYWLVFLLLIFALLLSFPAGRISAEWKEKMKRFIRITGFYYLALILWKYGFDKVFKGQFYLPEPNILYTPAGKLDKDILFWSSMGTSHLYNVLTGSFEVLAGALLLFGRTRNVGLLLSFGALSQVVFINFGFDISVKLFSCFLLLLNALLLYPLLKPLFGLLVSGRQEQVIADTPLFKNRGVIYIGLKVFIVGLFLLESVFTYLQMGSTNDDTMARPYLHGAYETIEAYKGDALIPFYQAPARRFFIHRRNYIIFQKQDDSMQDFSIRVDSAHNLIYVTDYDLKTYAVPFEYRAADSMLTIHYLHNGQQYTLKGKGLDWRKLPALKDEMHWRVED